MKQLKKLPKIYLLPLLGLVILYVLVVSRNIRYPGLHYDEMLFVNAALGAIDNSFIVERIGNVPVLLCAYMGALKAYLYFPIFSIFEVSPLSVRLPMIILTALSFLVLFRAARLAFQEKTAWVVFLLLLISPSIMAHTRMDNGPTAIQFFLKSVCLLLVFMYYRTGRTRHLLFLYGLLWVGIYYNVKYIWFINSLLFSSLLLYYDRLVEKVREKNVFFFIKIAAVCLAVFVPFVVYFVFISRDYPLVKHNLELLRKLLNFSLVLQGIGVYRRVLGPLSNPLGVAYLLLLGALLLGGTLSVFWPGNRTAEKTKLFLFFWGMIVTTLVQVFITPQARWSWHVFKVYPELLFLVAACTCEVGQVLGRQRPVFERTLFAVVLALLLVYNGTTFNRYLQAFKNQTALSYWSEAVYDLIDYTGRTPGRFFSATWGIHNQLISFHQDPYKFKELHEEIFRAETEAQKDFIFKACLRELREPHYFILRPELNDNWQKKINKNLFEIVRSAGLELEVFKHFYDQNDQQEIFILYRIKK